MFDTYLSKENALHNSQRVLDVLQVLIKEMLSIAVRRGKDVILYVPHQYIRWTRFSTTSYVSVFTIKMN